MCERLSAEAVRDTVNSFLTGMVECVDRYRGTVDKFVGDEIMALFGAPLHHDGHALDAIRTALDMQQTHQRWMDERRSRGLEAPPLGVGIATGHVVVGNIGTPSRMDYTALGSSVNLAARLCGQAEGISKSRRRHRHDDLAEEKLAVDAGTRSGRTLNDSVVARRVERPATVEQRHRQSRLRVSEALTATISFLSDRTAVLRFRIVR